LSIFGRIRLALAASFTSSLSLALAAPGCESTCEENGGIVVIDGGEEFCEEKCTPENCVEGNTCVNNRCRLMCEAQTDCFGPNAETPQACIPTVTDSKTGLLDGPVINICAPTPKAPKIGVTCTGDESCAAFLACPDGTDCAAGGCAPEACRPLACRSTGEDAYCTLFDCQADSDCAPGMFCRAVRVDGTLTGCTLPLGNTGKKGTGEPEIKCPELAAYNAQNGTSYQEGPESLLRNVCVKREGCAPCESTADCSLVEGAVCRSIGGANHCAKPCPEGDECSSDFACTEGFCVPRSGTCTPPQGAAFCHSCSFDSDCGPAGSSWACTTIGDTTACRDLSFPDACTVDEDCPTSPSGAHGECLDEEVGPSSPQYQRCFFPNVDLVDTCWP
jgi:hypothetical protein